MAPQYFYLPTPRALYCVIATFFIGTDSKSSVGGRVAGAVVGILVLIGAAVVTVVSIYLFTKWKRKQRVENLQMDIFAMYVVIFHVYC